MDYRCLGILPSPNVLQYLRNYISTLTATSVIIGDLEAAAWKSLNKRNVPISKAQVSCEESNERGLLRFASYRMS